MGDPVTLTGPTRGETAMVSLELQSAVAEGVHRCGSRRVNRYLIEADGAVIVVDAGFPTHYDLLVRSLQELDYAVSDVAACVLTHAHPDHIGFAQRLHEEEDVPVWIHEAGVRRAREGGDPPLLEMIRNIWRPVVFRYFVDRPSPGDRGARISHGGPYYGRGRSGAYLWTISG